MCFAMVMCAAIAGDFLLTETTKDLIHAALPVWSCVLLTAGDLLLLETTKDLIHGALSSPQAGRGQLANGEALDQQADDEFSSEVSSAIVDWIAKRMSDYHKNFHDTQLMQVLLRLLTPVIVACLLPPALTGGSGAWECANVCQTGCCFASDWSFEAHRMCQAVPNWVLSATQLSCCAQIEGFSARSSGCHLLSIARQQYCGWSPAAGRASSCLRTTYGLDQPVPNAPEFHCYKVRLMK